MSLLSVKVPAPFVCFGEGAFTQHLKAQAAAADESSALVVSNAAWG